MVYHAGKCRTFSGWEALDYLRQRKSLADGDVGRQRHIRQYLTAMYTKLADADPVTLAKVLAAGGSHVTVDLRGRSVDDLLQLTQAVDGIVSIGVDEFGHILDHPEQWTVWAAMRDGTLPQWAAANPRFLS
jgi:anionic cell wall polymer biosynthesis LytR-Cps2A-Psr (LCP) family protein